jgi:hypothetical protein
VDDFCQEWFVAFGRISEQFLRHDALVEHRIQNLIVIVSLGLVRERGVESAALCDAPSESTWQTAGPYFTANLVRFRVALPPKMGGKTRILGNRGLFAR